MFRYILLVIALAVIGMVSWQERVLIREYFRSETDVPPSVSYADVNQKNINSADAGVDEGLTQPSQPDEIGSINLAVPFQPQAPLANWEEPYGEACEEASLMMVDHFYRGASLSADRAKTLIDEEVSWQHVAWGGHYDLSVQQTVALADQFYTYESLVLEDPSVEDIVAQLQLGRPVIVPAAGRELGNPYFRQPGPLYHMLVIKGYDNGNFITNDPGTKQGQDYVYSSETIMKAINDWGEDELSGEKRVFVLYPGQPVTTSDWGSCVVSEDCLLVQESYCKGILAIQAERYDAWSAADERAAATATSVRQTCELTMAEQLDIDNYRAACLQGKCSAIYTYTPLY